MELKLATETDRAALALCSLILEIPLPSVLSTGGI